MPVPTALALPVAATSLAYLNARLGLSNDVSYIRAFSHVVANRIRAGRLDHISLFYKLEQHARDPDRADRIFLIFPGGRSYTYAQAYAIVLRYAAWLARSRGVVSGDIVAIDMLNGELYIWAWFALWSLGAVPAFINTNIASHSLLHCIKVAKTNLVLVHEDLAEKYRENVVEAEMEKSRQKVVIIDQTLRNSIESDAPSESFRAPDQDRGGMLWKGMAILIFTSGTTGMPKPAVLSWSKASLGTVLMANWLPLKEDDVVYTCMPLYHSAASILAVCAVLVAGTAVCVGQRFSNRTFWSEVRASNATIIQYVGETCRYLLAAPLDTKDKDNRVRLAYGNGLRPDIWNKFKDRFGIDTILELYAATEGPLALFNRSSNDYRMGAIGYGGALLNTLVLNRSTAIIRTDEETSMPQRDSKTGLCILANTNEPGELLVRLDSKDPSSSFQGYYANQEATNSKVRRNVKSQGDIYFATGDVVRRDKEGRWWFVDRAGDTFRWKAENVSTMEVSQVLGTCDVVLEANVYGVTVPGHDGRAGCAAVILQEAGAISSTPVSMIAKSEKEALPNPTPPPPSTPSPPRILSRAPPPPRPPTQQTLRPLRFTHPLPNPSQPTLDLVAAHATANLPGYAVPLFLRVTHHLVATGTNKHQKQHLRSQGVDPGLVRQRGDRMYWLRGGKYVEFGRGDWEALRGGRVRL